MRSTVHRTRSRVQYSRFNVSPGTEMDSGTRSIRSEGEILSQCAGTQKTVLLMICKFLHPLKLLSNNSPCAFWSQGS